MNVIYQIIGSFYAHRSKRAARIASKLAKKAEKFFSSVKGPIG